MKKFKSLSVLMISILVLAVFLVGCSTDDRLSIATGGTSGVYYPLGGAIQTIINDNVEGVTASTESTGASAENVNLINNGSADFALIQNDISYYAFNGVEMFENDEPMENLKAVASLYPETVQIVTNASANINSVEDLRGKRVAVGNIGSGAEANARQVLEAYGLTYEDITQEYLSFGEAADQLRDGHVEAAFLTAGTPTAAVTDLSTTHNINIISISQEVAQSLVAQFPFYDQVTIPAGTYRNQDEDVETVAVMAMLTVRAGLSEEVVYNATKAFFENLDTLANAHSRGGDITLEGAKDGVSLEIHPGAQRYYDEVNQ
ncbi:TAXI family TRAP transporter solute-binding subunit [Serpentinicella sp. ANB-PHB4]|uniref:TAXI family TRAP transporter solute-binding subunit n=1 Tax=Serpentinicella sp. ANB-PHB4 TaxID=3074076 RepID=UPI002864A3C6|nr:TAXI family TRAP transporter solute-binding subunit [Serpentinicella sp. ANB-PHB4]MDR5659082.1 TAXI family TRAP transporter solute-binding subunit [Serpentinicella sp. ANB-PHB4]